MQGRLVMPMAGEGRRFREAGYTASKPLIDVAGMPMFFRALAGLPYCDRTTLVAREQDREKIEDWFPTPRITDAIYLGGPTNGPAMTVMEALGENYDDVEDAPLLVADCDQIVDWDHKHFESWLEREKPDAALVVTRMYGDQYSYAKTTSGGEVVQVAEKQQISETACCGIWWWSSARRAWEAICEMLDRGKMVNGEFYIAPSFDILVKTDHRVLAYPVPRLYSMGTPEDLRATLDSGIFN